MGLFWGYFLPGRHLLFYGIIWWEILYLWKRAVPYWNVLTNGFITQGTHLRPFYLFNFFCLSPCSITLNTFWDVTEWLKTADHKTLENFNKSHKYLRKILMGDIIAREHIGLQVFAFCVVNVSDEHSRFKRNLRS